MKPLDRRDGGTIRDLPNTCATSRRNIRDPPALNVSTQEEDRMRHIILAAMLIGAAATAHAADDTGKSHDTAKGAAIGALAGHETGSGHAVAGAAAGAAIGHHEAKKADAANGK
jgi:hypothetical protein